MEDHPYEKGMEATGNGAGGVRSALMQDSGPNGINAEESQSKNLGAEGDMLPSRGQVQMMPGGFQGNMNHYNPTAGGPYSNVMSFMPNPVGPQGMPRDIKNMGFMSHQPQGFMPPNFPVQGGFGMFRTMQMQNHMYGMGFKKEDFSGVMTHGKEMPVFNPMFHQNQMPRHMGHQGGLRGMPQVYPQRIQTYPNPGPLMFPESTRGMFPGMQMAPPQGPSVPQFQVQPQMTKAQSSTPGFGSVSETSSSVGQNGSEVEKQFNNQSLTRLNGSNVSDLQSFGGKFNPSVFPMAKELNQRSPDSNLSHIAIATTQKVEGHQYTSGSFGSSVSFGQSPQIKGYQGAQPLAPEAQNEMQLITPAGSAPIYSQNMGVFPKGFNGTSAPAQINSSMQVPTGSFSSSSDNTSTSGKEVSRSRANSIQNGPQSGGVFQSGPQPSFDRPSTLAGTQAPLRVSMEQGFPQQSLNHVQNGPKGPFSLQESSQAHPISHPMESALIPGDSASMPGIQTQPKIEDESATLLDIYLKEFQNRILTMMMNHNKTLIRIKEKNQMLSETVIALLREFKNIK